MGSSRTTQKLTFIKVFKLRLLDYLEVVDSLRTGLNSPRILENMIDYDIVLDQNNERMVCQVVYLGYRPPRAICSINATKNERGAYDVVVVGPQGNVLPHIIETDKTGAKLTLIKMATEFATRDSMRKHDTRRKF